MILLHRIQFAHGHDDSFSDLVDEKVCFLFWSDDDNDDGDRDEDDTYFMAPWK